MARVARNTQQKEITDTASVDAGGYGSQVQNKLSIRDIMRKLSEPFPSSEVRARIGTKSRDRSKAQVLAYIDARTVMKRLDEVLGPENWQSELRPLGDKGFICRLSFRIPGTQEWLHREDVADLSAVEAIKGGASDSFKRAAVQLGIGQYLYDLPAPWVNLVNDQLPKAFKFPLPNWALPLNEQQEAATTPAPVLIPVQEEDRPWDIGKVTVTTDDLL